MNLSSRNSFRLALIQMTVQGGDPAGNLKRAEQSVAQAAQNGAQVILLPEAMNLGWTHRSAKTQAEEIPNGVFYQKLKALAEKHKLYLCAGLIEKDDTKVYNSAVLVGPNGHLLAHHRKLNELDLAHDLYSLGDRLQVARTPIGSLGLMICADGFAQGQVISRTLGYMGADLILSPSAWAVPADHDNQKEPYGKLWIDNYSPVARDFQLWIAGASNVGWIEDGPWRGRKCIGCSLVVGPTGEVRLQGPYGAEADIVLAIDIELAPRPAQGDQWARRWKR